MTGAEAWSGTAREAADGNGRGVPRSLARARNARLDLPRPAATRERAPVLFEA